MAQRIKPFETDSDKKFWMSNNCNICKRNDCYTRRCFNGIYLQDEITVKQADWIGFENGKLRSKCTNFNRPNVKCKSMLLEHDRFHFNMF